MTDEMLALATVRIGELETEARSAWDASVDNASEYQAAMGVVRQAVALRRALESWIVQRATQAQRAAVTR